jgi:signal transduction histidine kinase/CheY-like chemotaxis protein
VIVALASTRLLDLAKTRSEALSGDPLLGERILAESVRILFAKQPVALAAATISTAIVAVMLWGGVARPRVAGWVVALTVITAARLVLWRAYRRRGEAGGAVRWVRWFTAGALANGVAWGSAPLLFFGQSGLALRFFLAFVIGGMAAGAAGSLSSHLPAFVAFAAPAIAPLSVLFLMATDPVQLAMGFMMLVFGAAVTSIARTSGRAFADALALQLRNEDLVAGLSLARENLASANAALEERVAERTGALARVRALLEQAGVAVIVAELPGLRVVDVNEGACQIIGRARGEIEGAVLDELPAPGGGPGWKELASALGPFEVQTLEWEVPGTSDPPPIFELGVAARTFESREFLLVVGRDVTARKVLEREVTRAGLLASLGSVAASVGHEINGPLSYVLSSLRFLEEQLQEAPPRAGDPASEAVREALHGAERVRDIVRRLGALSHVERGAAGPIAVDGVVDLCIRLAEPELRQRARVVREYQVVPAVRGDRWRLSQVFLNLLVNAAQAIAPGRPEANEVRVGVRWDSGARTVVVEVADTGQGIPRVNLDRVFEPFFTTKPVGQGSGLGLAVCHGIVASLGGRISVSSVEGRGATFTVALPSAKEPASGLTPPAAAGQQAPPSSRPSRARVLVVDDDPHVARAIARALRNEDVSTAGSGVEAFALLQTEPFDLVVCDVMMPEMTGMELHERLRAARPGLERRMLFITGGVFTPDAAAFLARVPNPRLEKPFDVAALQAMVRNLVENGRGDDSPRVAEGGLDPRGDAAAPSARHRPPIP